MTWPDFKKAIEPLGIPSAYSGFEKPQKPPYLIYATTREPDFMADDSHYVAITEGFLELYTYQKMPVIETNIKKALTNNEVFWRFDYESKLTDQKLYIVRWAISFYGGNE